MKIAHLEEALKLPLQIATNNAHLEKLLAQLNSAKIGQLKPTEEAFKAVARQENNKVLTDFLTNVSMKIAHLEEVVKLPHQVPENNAHLEKLLIQVKDKIIALEKPPQLFPMKESYASLVQVLEQVNDKITQLEKVFKLGQVKENNEPLKSLEQAHAKIVQLEQTINETNQQNKRLEQKITKHKHQVTQLKSELIRVSQKTSLGRFMARLETGNQVIIVSSLPNQLEAQQKFNQLKIKYPALFYPQVNLAENIYQWGQYWVVFISGFYSYQAAVALKKQIVKLDLINDAFIVKNPFPEATNQKLHQN